VTEAETIALIDRIEGGKGEDSALDVLIEVALFEPDTHYDAARPNFAGTKVIYTRRTDGSLQTCWAFHWTSNRAESANLIRATLHAHKDLNDGQD